MLEHSLKAQHHLLLMAWVLPKLSVLAMLQWVDVDTIVRIVASLCALWLMIRQKRFDSKSQTRRGNRATRRVCPRCKQKG